MKERVRISRRAFLKAANAAVAMPCLIPSGVLAAPGRPGAGDRIVLGHIGWGGRSRGLYKELASLRDKGMAVSAAVCDVDETRLGAGFNDLPKVTPYRDYRYLLERKDIDAVVIGTPDHWHGVQTVHAAECGKHVYVEKPACCTIEEGRAMIAAAKKSRVSVQVGSQGRSQPEAWMMHRYLANSVVGKVQRVECFHYPSPEDTKPVPDSEPPPHIDWDLWLGPLRWRPFNERYLHGTFRWVLESGGGQIRDRGAHVMSCAMGWLGRDGTGPVKIEASGTPPKQGLWDSAVLMKVTYTFRNPDWVMTWTQMPNEELPQAEVRTDEELETGRAAGITRISRPGYGAIYHGDQGKCMHWGGDGGTWAERKVREWKPPAGAKEVYKSPGHFEDWFESIRTGRKPIMNIEAGVGVANLTILGNIAFLLGRPVEWDQAKMEILGDEEARRLMSRPQRHPYYL